MQLKKETHIYIHTYIFLCMHQILVHAQDSCACTRLLYSVSFFNCILSMTQYAVNPRKRDLCAEKLAEIHASPPCAVSKCSPPGWPTPAAEPPIGAPHAPPSAEKAAKFLEGVHATTGGPLTGAAQALVVEFDDDACTHLKDKLNTTMLMDVSTLPGTYWGIATDFNNLNVYKQNANPADMEQQDCILLFIILQICVHIYTYIHI